VNASGTKPSATSSVHVQDLRESLQLVRHSIGAVGWTRDVEIAAVDGLMRVRSTNGSIMTIVSFPCDLRGAESASAVVPHEAVLSAVRRSIDPTWTLEFDDRRLTASGRSSKWWFPVSTTPIPESIAKVSPSHVVRTTAAGALSEMLVNIAAAADSDAAANYVKGVRLLGRGGRLLMDATDGRRISRCCGVEGADAPDGLDQIVPIGKPLTAIAEALRRDDGAALRFGGGMVEAECGGCVVRCPCAEASFPDIDRFIPTAAVPRFGCDAAALSAALADARSITTADTRTVMFDCRADSVTISSRGEGRGEAEIGLMCSSFGTPVRLFADPSHIEAALAGASGPVSVECDGPRKPLVFRCGDRIACVAAIYTP